MNMSKSERESKRDVIMAAASALERFKKDCEEIAGEDVEAKKIGGAFYVFCSELGAHRIFYKYRHAQMDRVRVGYSENLDSHYFVLEV